MRQQINLFQDSLRPRHIRCSAQDLSRVVIISVVIMFLIEVFGIWQTWQMKQDFAEAEIRFKVKTEELKNIEVKYPRAQEDQRLVHRLKLLDEERLQKQQILGILSDGQYGNTHGFADHLEGLSKQHVAGLWLTRLSIDEGGKQMGLSGGSIKPELVPRFIQRLGSEPSFAGKEFKSFLLSKIEKSASWVHFDLNTQTIIDSQQ